MDYKSLWQNVLTKLSPIIGRSHILTVFKDTAILNVENGVMTIGVSSPITYSFIKQRFEVKLVQVIREAVEGIREVVFEIKSSLMDETHPHKVDVKTLEILSSDDKAPRKVPNKQEVILSDGTRSKMFKDKYTLKTFLAGTVNRLAHAACMAVAAKPGSIYNPLFLYGGVGLGKTHLLQGIGNEINKLYPNKKVVYMTSEKFINEIVQAIGFKHTRNFKDKYRNVDCLIVDDIQFFGNKATSQQEFFHTFNELYDAGKQIIISSDRPPSELDQLEDRLTSRFKMGMVIEVQMPDIETRMAILMDKCQELEVMIDREVLELVATHVTSSVRELEGILLQAIAEAQLTNTNPTLRSVAEVMKKLYSRMPSLQTTSIDLPKRPDVRTCDDLIAVVADYYKLSRADLISEGRKKEIMVPRQICMYLIREMLSQSYETIGDHFGGKNHTTVMHACHKVEEELKAEGKILRDINALKREIGFMH
jgi:chromosomal replication initiator protein